MNTRNSQFWGNDITFIKCAFSRKSVLYAPSARTFYRLSCPEKAHYIVKIKRLF